MRTLEALVTTATTVERIEALLTESNERDILAAVRLTRLEVARMADEEEKSPGRYDGLTN
jgi:hypothetical protein